MAKVTPEPTSGCWLWAAALNNLGYGVMTIAHWDERFAHRISWRLEHGEIPNGLCVLHRCDNPACVNPTHLFLGTKSDNTRDMVSKGRARGAEPTEGFCRRGHAYSIRPTGRKKCRECENEAQRSRRAA